MIGETLEQCASPVTMPRWWNCICAWVQASVFARSNAIGSRCLSARSSTSSRDAAASVQNATRAVAPRGIRTCRRRLKIGVEHGANGIRQRPAFGNGSRRANGLPPPKKTRAIGLELHMSGTFAFDDGKMCRPYLRVGRRTPAAGRQDRADVGDKLRFDEQCGEGRMRHVVGLPREDDFGVGGDFEIAACGAHCW